MLDWESQSFSDDVLDSRREHSWIWGMWPCGDRLSNSSGAALMEKYTTVECEPPEMATQDVSLESS